MTRLPTLLGYERTTERVSLETWMNIYCALTPEERADPAVMKNGRLLSQRWLNSLPRPY